MDLLRGMAILLVILHHVSLVQQIWDGGTPHAGVVLSEAAKPFRMPALLFASGMLLPRSLRRPGPRFLSGKARGLLWPWLLWSAIMLPIMGWEFGRDPLWWINGMYTWFLLALFLYYVLGLLTRSIPPGWVALACLVAWTVMQMLGSALEDPAYRPDKFVYFAVFFFAGAALRRVVLARTMPIALLAPGVLLALGWAAYAARIDRAPEPPVLSHLVVLISVLVAIGLAQRVPRLRIVRALEWLGRHSIVLYVVHLPVIELLARHLDLPPGRASFALYALVTFGVCVLAVLLRPITGFLYTFPALRAAEPVAKDRHPGPPVPAADPQMSEAPVAAPLGSPAPLSSPAPLGSPAPQGAETVPRR
ncbi:hypothetical protein GCM10009626_18940 [Brachybacterium sacelli]